MGVELVGGGSHAILGVTTGTAEDVSVAGDLSGAVVAGGVSLSAAQPASDATATVPAANAAAVVTFNAVAGQRHRLTMLGYSYGTAPTAGRLTVLDGATTIIDLDITAVGPGVLPIPPGGIRGSVNTAMVATLAAGGAGVQGKIFAAKLTA